MKQIEELIALVRSSDDVDVAALRAVNGVLDLIEAGVPINELREHASNIASAIPINTPFKPKGARKERVNK